ncbi:MAG: AEC family transporter [Chitinophagales bacterium]|nr:AEC family transporter [Chitinophagales bacterium]
MFHESLAFLLICLGAGLAVKKWQLLPNDTFKKVNKFILYFTIPAITLEKISQIDLRLEYLAPTISGWGLFILAGIFFGILKHFYKWDKKTWAALTLGCGLGNTSFVGYPVTQLIYGEQGLQYAIFVDQPGTFACLSTLGIALAAYASGGQLTFKSMAWRLITFPAFTCFFIALIIPSDLFRQNIFGDILILKVLRYIGSWTNPLAFLSIGMQFSFSFSEINTRQFGWGLAYKLLLGPLVFWLVFFLLGLEGMIYDVSVLELAMPPMITAFIIATEYNLSPKLSASLVNYGLPASALTLYLWGIFLK